MFVSNEIGIRSSHIRNNKNHNRRMKIKCVCKVNVEYRLLLKIFVAQSDFLLLCY